jgi:uncharacterized repeat protein (TIGR03803 family)
MRHPQYLHSLRLFVLGLTVIFLAGRSFASSPHEKLLYSFQGPTAASGQDGEGPGDLISDEKGNLYGVTAGGGICLQVHFETFPCGTVFELSPPASTGGSWTETVIYEFGTNPLDGQSPRGNLVRDKQGNLYGTTFNSGGGVDAYGCGNFFELSPPSQPGSAWTETILYNFQGGSNDGCGSLGTLVSDSKGNIYGPTSAGGSLPKGSDTGGIFEMSPPASAGGAWTETFTQNLGGGTYPAGALTIDKNGILYGTSVFNGIVGPSTVFKLIPPSVSGGTWTGTTIYTSQGGTDGSAPGGLTIDGKGNLYGVTENGGPVGDGTAYRLSPSQTGSWTKTTLYSFQGGADGVLPISRMIFDKAGNLYGTTKEGGGAPACAVFQGCGTIFELVRSATGWSERVVNRFQGPDGSYPQSSLFLTGSTIYGTTIAGGALVPSSYGTIFEIK